MGRRSASGNRRERLAALQPQLAALFDGVEVLVARDRSPRMREYDPEVHTEVTRTRAPEDHLKGARSVIVVGLRLPRASVERTALPPAEAVGPVCLRAVRVGQAPAQHRLSGDPVAGGPRLSGDGEL